MEGQTATDFVKKEISEYLDYLYKTKSLVDFYKATRNVISFRLENHIYNFVDADKALTYLDEFFRKQEEVEKKQNEIKEKYKKNDRDDDQR